MASRKPPKASKAAHIIELAIRHHKSGDLTQAETLYLQALKRDPSNPDILYFLGAIAYQTGKYVTSEERLRQAIRINATAPAYHNGLGLALQSLGRLDEAAACFESALKVNPQFVDAYCNRGNTYRLLGRLADATDAYQQALALHPQFAEAHNGLGKVYASEENREPEARACFERALTLNPTLADTYNSLGLLSVREGNLSAAEQQFRRAIGFNPELAEAHNNLGRVLVSLGQPAEAEECYRRAIRMNPRLSDIHINLGNALSEQGKSDEALSEYEIALHQTPDPVPAIHAMGVELEREGRLDEALTYFQQTLSLRPNDTWLQVKMAMLLPAIPNTIEDLLRWRARFEAEISRLMHDNVTLEDVLGNPSLTKFYLSYHGLNNRQIHTQVAQLYERACPTLLWSAPHCHDWQIPTKRIRVGFISKFMYAHSIGRTTRGLVAKLSRDRFEVHALFVPPFKDDSISQFIRDNSDASLILPETLENARKAIADLELDVLFYQDIGMEPFTYFLAFSRLAPVQCLSFGHPDTTGIANLDYFVSSDLFEPPDASTHYSEKLFLLRNLGTLAYYYRPAALTSLKQAGDFGLPTDAHIYICPQTLFKFHPDFDAVLGDILRADPSGRLVLMEGGAKLKRQARLLKARLIRTCPDVIDRIVFMPNLNGDDFLNIIAISDVMLDTIHFNGMNTSLEAFAMGTPVVTLPGAFQRARHTFGMYTRMGIMDCIAHSPEEYVKIAVRLATDKTHRNEISARILASNGVIFEDINVVREFERFFIEACEQASSRASEITTI